MLTGITSCTIGSTNAPPPSTTFCPPSPVRTKLRSFDDRRYSQWNNHTITATTIATVMRLRMKMPKSDPLMTSLDEAVLRCLDLAFAVLNVLRRAPQRNLGAARYAFQNFLAIPSNGDKSFVCCVSATSVGRRSMLDAP